MTEALVVGIALSLGAAWASGVNVYATVFILGFLGGNGYIDLPPSLDLLGNQIFIAVAFLLYWIEFFMDKVPGVDSGWDALHTFIRVPAGAVLAAGAVGDAAPMLQLAAGVLGGGLAATGHAMKAGTRVLINATPEPFSNWTASVAEDLLVIGGLWTALYQPTLFLSLLVVWTLLLIWLLPKIWRGVTQLAHRVKGWFAPTSPTSPTLPTTTLVSGEDNPAAPPQTLRIRPNTERSQGG